MKEKRSRIGRREFFRQSFSGLAGISLLSSRLPAGHGRALPASQKPPSLQPLHRQLGKTGLNLPIVSLGVMNADNPDLVRKAFELGVRHFDTAHSYQRGRNEEMIGRVLQELGAREKVIIATKAMSPSSRRGLSSRQVKEAFIKAVDESLKRLRTDFVDILYAHDVKSAAEVSHPGLVEALAYLKDQKKARFVGFSTHANMVACLEEACRTRFYDVVLTSFNYALADDRKLLATLQKADQAGIGLIAMKTQCSQYWYRDSLPRSQQRFYEGQILHLALLKWVLRHDFICTAIPGCTTFAQLEEDWKVAFDLAYTPEEEAFLRDRQVKTSLAYCVQCADCVPTCPQGVDLPALLRSHMYLTGYGNVDLARQALEEIAPGRGLEACRACPSCQAACHRGLPLTARLEEINSVLA